MASIVLGSIGSAAGNAVGGSAVSALLGRQAGQLVGGVIDQQLSRSTRKRFVEGARLEELAVQTSTYGRIIPTIFGTARVAGNIIWAQPIKEMQTTTSTTRSSGKGGSVGGGASQTTVETSYSYYATMAVAVCAGPISSISRIWADAKLLSLGQYTMRIYTGTGEQLPDALIQAYEGDTTAHRDLAYVVFEDFPLADFGNRIPNFTFEVTRKIARPEPDQLTAEEQVTSVMLIPGSGEYVYDTVVQNKAVGEEVGGQWVQRGNQVTLNMHNVQNIANVHLALDQLLQTFPNLEYVGVVVNWFASSLHAASAVIEPCVEFPATTRVSPDEWVVAGRTRATARVITYDDGAPRYGGTPSDAGVVRLLQVLNERGLRVMFYPMLLVDAEGKPWRGHITASAANIPGFFTRSDGYNAFITHYATLTNGHVDAFVIGSEMKGLTSVASSPGVYPAVSQLVSLAATVQGLTSAKVTYAADWSEYHHAEGGWYNMDPLWASAYIDFIGIDAYFPLTDEPQDGIDKQAIRDGWASGEGYDWHYTDEARTMKAALAPEYAWKNIAWWWNNAHVNPNSVATAWVPQSKKIWFTEYGFASVDGTTNQPNVFVDPASDDSAFPRFSRARVDLAIQRAAIEATEEAWDSTAMVERKFLWAWDARPYPQWPDLLDIWSDGANWETGHWVQGKLGLAQLGGAVRELLILSGLDEAYIDCSELTDTLEGFVVYQRMTVREALEQLMMAYPFDIVETGGMLKAIKRGKQVSLEFMGDECLPTTDGEQRVRIEMRREQEMELPCELEVIYLNRLNGYNAGAQRAFKHTAGTQSKLALKMSIVLSDQHARIVAERQLAARWLERNRFQLQLPIRYAAIEPGDVIRCIEGAQAYTMRVESTQFGKPGIVRIEAVEEDPSLYDSYIPAAASQTDSAALQPLSDTACQILDIPALPGDMATVAKVRVAATGISANWPGAALYQLRPAGDLLLARVGSAACMGHALGVLANASSQRVDEVSYVDVSLYGEATLASAIFEEVLDGANLAVLGDELFQFMQATPLDEGKYRLSGLLRGRYGTEYATAGHGAGERFVLLDGHVRSFELLPEQRGRSYDIAAVTYGKSLDVDEAVTFTPQLRALQPYAPVHLGASRAGDGAITLSWIRRTRLYGEWQDHQDVPLNEEDERYDIEILNGASVVHTARTVSAGYIYSAAQQINDFGGVQPSIRVRIYQLSALVGRGMPAESLV